MRDRCLLPDFFADHTLRLQNIIVGIATTLWLLAGAHWKIMARHWTWYRGIVHLNVVPSVSPIVLHLTSCLRSTKLWDTCRVGSALTLHHCTEWFWVGWQSGWFSIHRATLLCTTMNQVSLLCTTLPLCHPAMHVHYALSHSTISLSLHNPILLLDSYELIALTSTPQVLYLHSTISCISYYPAKP